MLRLIAAFGFALALAACGPLPRPFQPDEKALDDNPLLRMADFGGVIVPPAFGLPEDQSRALAEAVAKSLREFDVPANVRAGNPRSLILDLQAERVAGRVRIAANLVDPQGTALADPHAEGAAPAAPDKIESWAALARPIAQAIVNAIKPAAVAARAAPAIHVAGVEGAPGDGGRALSRSLAFHLERVGLRIVDAPGPDVIDVVGTVAIANAGADTRRVSVNWRVRDSAGAELGRVDMQNPVPVQVLDRQWAELAFEIAGASADGIRDIAERFRIPAR
ncbi:MAG: hypothetical protein JNL71_13030 [Rhodospirillales bacterium]|nr:hypothetical protein [Rhodospirillales bacterium]